MRSFHASQHPPRGHGRTETHYPEFHRDLPSVHEYVAATRHTLPDFSPRPAFGCRFGAVTARRKPIPPPFRRLHIV